MWVKTRRHRILVELNGSFIIYRETPLKKFAEEFEKSGANP